VWHALKGRGECLAARLLSLCAPATPFLSSGRATRTVGGSGDALALRQLTLAARRRESSAGGERQAFFTEIFLPLVAGVWTFGSTMVSTPFLKEASTFWLSTSAGSAIERSNEP
jgi:hypothetical protein